MALAAAAVVLAVALQRGAAIQGGAAAVVGRLDVDRACADAQGATFPEFVRMHNRTYWDDPEEYARRAEIFEARTATVVEHNCARARPLWTARVNHFADWSDAELLGTRGTMVQAWGQAGASGAAGNLIGSKRKALPDTISWANLSTIQAPQDQGRCGSCWAFAATTAMQARAEMRGLPHRLSVGQVVACAPNPDECGGRGGCSGATTELAYEYALQTGLEAGSRLDYRRRGGKPPSCPSRLRMPAERSEVHLTADGSEEHSQDGAVAQPKRVHRMGLVGWKKLPVNREAPIILALMESGPLTVSLAASTQWHFYHGGIMPPTDCDPMNVVGHAMVLFGIGQEAESSEGPVRFWHLKNSWGETWGEAGNIRLQRVQDEEATCGWDNHPEVGDGCRGGPSKVWVCGSCGILYNAAMPVFAPRKS